MGRNSGISNIGTTVSSSTCLRPPRCSRSLNSTTSCAVIMRLPDPYRLIQNM